MLIKISLLWIFTILYFNININNKIMYSGTQKKKWVPTQKKWTQLKKRALTQKKEPYSIIILSNLKL